jgi:hypothetical protein
LFECPTHLDFMCNMAGVLKETGTAYHLRASGFIREFVGGVLVAHHFVLSSSCS